MSRFDAVTDAVVLQEQRWVYERRVERLSYAQIVDRAALPASEGGIGRTLSMATLKRRWRDYLDQIRELEAESLDEHRGRELANLDAREQTLKAQCGRVDVEASLLRARVATGRSMTYDEVVADCPEAIVLRDERVIVAASAALLKVSEARRKLIGLDAPAQAQLEVTHREATMQDLFEARDRLGLWSPGEREEELEKLGKAQAA